MKRGPTMGHADARPRIHVWPAPQGVTYSHGPTGRRMKADTPGAAVDLALGQLCAEQAVVIIGPQP